MRKILSFMLGFAAVIIASYFLFGDQSPPDDIAVHDKDDNLPKIKSNQTTKEIDQLLSGNIFAQMNKPKKELVDEFGEPDRKDLTPYGYTWWIYTDEETNVMQFGIEDDKVQTIFATGEDIESEPFAIGASYEKIEEEFPFDSKITYQKGLSFFSFLLNETDVETSPLIKISDDIFVQLYFDTLTEELSSIRVAAGDILLKQRFYEMEYRGNLPEEADLTEEDWEKIEKGMEQQIFDLTNIYRNRYGVSPLILDDNVSEVAYLHSKDMNEHNYFSHYSQDGSGLKERLERKEVYYISAGENIAAQHTDAAAAVEGWLNSESHREAMLNESYSHLGVGVHRYYYTQNYLLKP